MESPLSVKNLLLTNDDGIDGEGLVALAKALEKVANVYILAPESNRSGVSNHITIEEDLHFTKVGENAYTCSGYPCDCAIVGLISDLFPVHFDAVVSGINKGPNLGTDLLYSGTAAAARQAVSFGYPGIAISLGEVYDGGVYDYEVLARFVSENLDTLISLSDIKKGLFVNINAPRKPSFSGVVFAESLSLRNYNDSITLLAANNENLYGKVMGGRLVSTGPADSDFELVHQGKVVISLIPTEPVCSKCPQGIEFKL